MAEPLFHPEAQVEYSAAIAWYELRSPRTASRFEAEVERMLTLIAASPDLFPKYDDDHRFAILRRFPYSIVYKIQERQTYVVAVPHSSRSPGYWQGRR